MIDTFALWPMGHGFHWWQLLTYALVHINIFHLAINSIVLWSFGRKVKNAWLIGIASVIGGAAWQLPFLSTVPLAGASAACFGLVMAYGLQKPDAKVWLFFTMTAEQLAGRLLGLSIAAAMVWPNSIAHWAHVGGMITAYFSVRRYA